MTTKDITRRQISAGHSIIERIQYLSKVLDDTVGPLIDTPTQQAYLEYLDALTETLTAERKKIPLGKRYTGTFYLRKQYTSQFQPEFDKITGSLFMRTGTERWRVEHVTEGVTTRDGSYAYVCESLDPDVFINEDEAVLVFEDDTPPWET